ncbi:LacI family DNA-binding transcriptional regulator [Echinimonas agarilytica]|uniref:LacI family DNA-binding transcriptional regulator n=1 Tax=Echinimonas agarilytica TaxID=1215918 RepID=A0AA42B6B6_9GAMM|nr:LacI family DNA-binding transcriptional regulator [Echinimonas agarilytica]MCM2678413.1 LacI family DNA-binding transcriptional regulator [Echinimonas agarilytica]
MITEQRPTTIQDVAERAGVSKMTVSRVLNHDSKVSDTTRAKVMKAVQDMNYRPNISARQLAGSKSYFIGLLYDNPSQGYVSQFLLGALKRCRASGYHLVVDECNGGLQDKLKITRDLVNSTRVDGVILLPPLCDVPEIIDILRQSNTPYIRISPDVDLDSSAYVCMDDYQAAYEMTNELIKQGHNEIGFVIGHPNQGSSRLRYQGFLDAMRSNRISCPPEYIEQGYFTYKSGLQAANKLFALEHPPSAIFASNDDMAAAVTSAAHIHGLKVPEDVSVVGFDDIQISTTIWPPLTTIRQPINEMAERAIELIYSGKLNEPRKQNRSDYRNVIDFELVKRDSLQPKQKS